METDSEVLKTLWMVFQILAPWFVLIVVWHETTYAELFRWLMNNTKNATVTKESETGTWTVTWDYYDSIQAEFHTATISGYTTWKKAIAAARKKDRTLRKACK